MERVAHVAPTLLLDGTVDDRVMRHHIPQRLKVAAKHQPIVVTRSQGDVHAASNSASVVPNLYFFDLNLCL
jgi:hypothetical protein